MVDKISSWASGLIVAVLIGTIIEMILPDNKNKKYVKVVIGLFIIYTIIAPVIGSLDNFTLDVNNLLSDYTRNETVATSASAHTSLENTYKQNIEDDIKLKLKDMGYNVNKISTEINFEDENYGMINSISLKLKTDEELASGMINNLQAVEINVELESEQSKQSESSAEVDEIKKYLNENYGTDLKNIYIQLV